MEHDFNVAISFGDHLIPLIFVAGAALAVLLNQLTDLRKKWRKFRRSTKK